jgi:type I restriction enzyme S subunit
MVKEGYKEVKALGEKYIIPEEWSLKELSEVLTVIRNGSSKKQNKQGKGLPVSRIETIADGTINYDKIGYVDLESEDLKKHKLEKGDILFSHINSIAHIGKVAQYKADKKLYHGMNLLKLRFDNEKVTDQFMLHRLKSVNAKHFYERYAKQAVNQASLNQNDVGLYTFPLPPLPEQKKIASILSSVDRSIEKTDEVIEETKELKKGLMQELFTRGVSGNDLRLSPHENNDLYKNSYLGFVPEDWIDYQISDIAETDYGLNSAIDKTLSKGIKMISVGNVNKDGTLDFDDVNYAIEDKISSEDILLKGDILFNWRNGSKEHLGKTIYFDLNDEFTHVGLLIRIRTNKNENIYSKFLYYFMRYIHFKQFFTRAKKQVNNTFNKTELNNLQVFIPPLEEQKKIASILSSVDAKIQKEEEYKEKLEKLKKGLMQKILTGEIRVNKDMEV